MRFTCRNCGSSDWVLVAPVFELVAGWFGGSPRKRRSGFLARCTHQNCGQEWIVTASGLARPGITAAARVTASPDSIRNRERDRRDDSEPEGVLRNAVPRADV